MNTDPSTPMAADRRVVVTALLALTLGAAVLQSVFSGREAALLLLGAALGMVLFHAAFGFASSWRRFLFAGRRGHQVYMGTIPVRVGLLAGSRVCVDGRRSLCGTILGIA